MTIVEKKIQNIWSLFKLRGLFIGLRLFFCVFFFSSGAVKAQKKNKNIAVLRYCFKSLDETIQSELNNCYYLDCSVIFMRNYPILYWRYFGDYDSDIVFHNTSAGIWLVIATVATLVNKGSLQWTDPVRKWLPNFIGIKMAALQEPLLSNTSGYPDYEPKGWPPDDNPTLDRSGCHIVYLLTNTVLDTVFKHGGLAIQTAGSIAEISARIDWESLFQQ